MNDVLLKEVPAVSKVECAEYFPLRVVFDSSADGAEQFITYSDGKYNLLEFTVDEKSSQVKALQIVVCRNYQRMEKNSVLPSSAASGWICLMSRQSNHCDFFQMTVYTNSIQIALSPETPYVYYAMGQVLFGINSSSDLVSLIITNLTADEMEHTRFELQEQRNETIPENINSN